MKQIVTALIAILDLPGARNHQSSMLDAPQTQQLITEPPDLSAPPLHDDDFQAIAVVQVHVGGGEHLRRGVMLGVDKFFGEPGPVMIVHHRQSAHDDLVFVHRLLYQVLANEVANGFVPVTGSFPVDCLIKPLQQIAV